MISTPSVASLLVPPVSGGQFAGAVRGLVFLFTQRTQRTQSYNANYAAAEVVAGYARQSAQRQRKTENGERKSV